MPYPPSLPPRRFVAYKTPDYRVFLVRRNPLHQRWRKDFMWCMRWVPSILLYFVVKYILYRLGIIHSMK